MVVRRGVRMAEYIEREALVAELAKGTIITDDIYGMGIMTGLGRALTVAREIPAADVAPVVHARWDNDGRCTHCGGHAPYWAMASTYYASPYCFECGARMDGD